MPQPVSATVTIYTFKALLLTGWFVTGGRLVIYFCHSLCMRVYAWIYLCDLHAYDSSVSVHKSVSWVIVLVLFFLCERKIMHKIKVMTSPYDGPYPQHANFMVGVLFYFRCLNLLLSIISFCVHLCSSMLLGSILSLGSNRGSIQVLLLLS